MEYLRVYLKADKLAELLAYLSVVAKVVVLEMKMVGYLADMMAPKMAV